MPLALEGQEALFERLAGRRPAVFLDYDGTLTGIVDRPEDAHLSSPMRQTIAALASRCPVAVISGRDRRDVAARVGLPELIYAGSHGFDIAGPHGTEIQYEAGGGFTATIERAARELRYRLLGIDGVIVESKRYSVAVHYRLVAPGDRPQLVQVVEEVLAAHPDLRQTDGKMVFELRPALDWDKGRALEWLLRALGLDGPDVVPIYLGDDSTDEDAFRALAGRGIGILVADAPRATLAACRLRDPAEVEQWLQALVGRLAAPRG
ncbi:MAG: trehalose-phosphatase [Acidobacteriota bacterium]|nr:trehalose-phosphatase [Acidobacteriota bacterium]